VFTLSCFSEFLQAQEIVPLHAVSAVPDEASRAKSGREKRKLQRAGNNSKKGHPKRLRHSLTNESDDGPSGQTTPQSLDEDSDDVDMISFTPCKDEEEEENLDVLKAELRDVQGRIKRAEAKKKSRQSEAVKKETSPIRLKSSSGDVIDLTDD